MHCEKVKDQILIPSPSNNAQVWDADFLDQRLAGVELFENDKRQLFVKSCIDL